MACWATCGSHVAPLTGLKTEAQIVTTSTDVIGAGRRDSGGSTQDYPQSTHGRHSPKLLNDRRPRIERGDGQARGLPRLEEASRKYAKACRWRHAAGISASWRHMGGLYVPQELAPRRGRHQTGLPTVDRGLRVRRFADRRSDDAEDMSLCICR